MFKHWLAITLRHMGRHRGYTAVNVLGLAVGMACAILIFLYIQYELSYDQHHEKADRIYRVAVNEDARSPRSMVLAMQEDFPEVRQFVRLLPTFGTWIMRYEDRLFYEKRVYWADQSLFDVFTMPLVRGDPDHALEAPYTVVISEDVAGRYFGDEDPVGKTMIADNGFLLLTVTGVIENIPENAHFRADFFISLATGYEKFNWTRTDDIWSAFLFYTYVVFPEGHSPAETEAKLPGFVERHIGDRLEARGGRFDMRLQSVKDIHLYSHLENEPGVNTDISYVYILAAIGLFILAIASVNYVNLSTAQYAHRGHEVGMRKVLGASRTHLVRQSLGESVLLTLIALTIALAAVQFVSPHFDALLGMPVTASFVMHPGWWLGPLLIAVLIGILSGGYPALVFSSMLATPGLEVGRRLQPGGVWSRRTLVGAQFAVSIALIIGTGILFSQASYIQNKNLGFEKEQVIVIPTVEEVARNYQPWKDELIRYAGVTGVSLGASLPGLVGNIGRVSAGTVQRAEDPVDVRHDVQGLQAAADFVETLGMDVLAGRSHRGPLRDSPEEMNVLINEAALRALGWETPEEAIGREVRFGNNMMRTVIGVLGDFHFRTLHLPIEPLVLFHGIGQHLVIRLDPGEIRPTLEHIEQTWTRSFPDYPFAFTFLGEDIDRLYRNETRIGYFFAVFALIAVFLTCLGLFALVSYTVERRVREIGIRRAIGASLHRLLATLSAEFVGLVLVANLVAWPAAWLIMGRWMENFAYRIEIGWGIFFASGGIALLITIVTIGYHVFRAALANPAEVLRGE